MTEIISESFNRKQSTQNYSKKIYIKKFKNSD